MLRDKISFEDLFFGYGGLLGSGEKPYECHVNFYSLGNLGISSWFTVKLREITYFVLTRSIYFVIFYILLIGTCKPV